MRMDTKIKIIYQECPFCHLILLKKDTGSFITFILFFINHISFIFYTLWYLFYPLVIVIKFFKLDLGTDITLSWEVLSEYEYRVTINNVDAHTTGE